MRARAGDAGGAVSAGGADGGAGGVCDQRRAGSARAGKPLRAPRCAGRARGACSPRCTACTRAIERPEATLDRAGAAAAVAVRGAAGAHRLLGRCPAAGGGGVPVSAGQCRRAARAGAPLDPRLAPALGVHRQGRSRPSGAAGRRPAAGGAGAGRAGAHAGAIFGARGCVARRGRRPAGVRGRRGGFSRLRAAARDRGGSARRGGRSGGGRLPSAVLRSGGGDRRAGGPQLDRRQRVGGRRGRMPCGVRRAVGGRPRRVRARGGAEPPGAPAPDEAPIGGVDRRTTWRSQPSSAIRPRSRDAVCGGRTSRGMASAPSPRAGATASLWSGRASESSRARCTSCV